MKKIRIILFSILLSIVMLFSINAQGLPDFSKQYYLFGTTSIGKSNALKSAKNYLSFTTFSYSGLIKQLEFEKYTHEEAVYAVENCGANWNEQAVKSAQNYLSFSSFSKEGLIKQLEYEGFTNEQARYAADVVMGGGGMSIGNSSDNTIGKMNALKSAQNYLSFTAFSYSGLVKQLEFEKYTHEEAIYAADNCGANWNEQATKSAQNYLSFSSFSRDSLIRQLEYEGFTHEQALYGVSAVGY